jgi:hypothetical protein
MSSVGSDVVNKKKLEIAPILVFLRHSMNRRHIFLICGFLLLSATTASAADPPAYLLLRTPPAPGGRHPHYNAYPGRPYTVHTQTYSYGWFGAQPRRHWSRQFGYYRNYGVVQIGVTDCEIGQADRRRE